MRKNRQILSIDELRKIVSYDPETGIFRWLQATAHCVDVGEIIDSIDDKGYVRFNILGVAYRAHRLAWAFMTGAWPVLWIDHWNTVRSDNRWTNLRQSTRSINMQNQRQPHSGNKTGFLGVCRDRKGYRAQITVDGKVRRIGTYRSVTEAHAAYLAAKRKLHPGCTI